MIYRIAWSSPAAQSLRALPWRQAERVDAAVQRYAATGEGSRFRYEADEPLTFRLEVRTPHKISRRQANDPRRIASLLLLGLLQ